MEMIIKENSYGHMMIINGRHLFINYMKNQHYRNETPALFNYNAKKRKKELILIGEVKNNFPYFAKAYYPEILSNVDRNVVDCKELNFSRRDFWLQQIKFTKDASYIFKLDYKDRTKELFNEIIENKYTNFNILCGFSEKEEYKLFGEYLSKDEREEIKKKAQEQFRSIWNGY